MEPCREFLHSLLLASLGLPQERKLPAGNVLSLNRSGYHPTSPCNCKMNINRAMLPFAISSKDERTRQPFR